MQAAEYTALHTNCPRRTCGAKAGEQCRDRSGRLRGRMHSGRFHAGKVRPSETVDERVSKFWYLTVAEFAGKCTGCGLLIRPEDPIVIRKGDQQTVCSECSERRDLRPRKSRRWRAHHGDDA